MLYADKGDQQNAIKDYKESLSLRKTSGDKWGEEGCLDNIGLIYM